MLKVIIKIKINNNLFISSPALFIVYIAGLNKNNKGGDKNIKVNIDL